ncbi:hypothetical protein COLINT_03612 [Collinsella intestinalis DSM 13280]|uniref:Uncharacterized protein n=1 Tax=Collinsella intestinalis DSM 13280 TaxID=521003 RepID=C4FBZ3_9ACTN|nr:hypothetical protein COLINT_03612 [Collinsella intestinalis DSM 13280]
MCPISVMALRRRACCSWSSIPVASRCILERSASGWQHSFIKPDKRWANC